MRGQRMFADNHEGFCFMELRQYDQEFLGGYFLPVYHHRILADEAWLLGDKVFVRLFGLVREDLFYESSSVALSYDHDIYKFLS
jgi:hypothetical protein